MAVYKPTYCYPFLNNIDIRVIDNENGAQPAEWLKCKIDTSNKTITGYRIKVLDENNNQVFPAENANSTKLISPISELTALNLDPLEFGDGVNSGQNGTYLYIPFFQQKTGPLTQSYNAVYFNTDYVADYISGDDSTVWTVNGNTATSYIWDTYFNGESTEIGDTVFMYNLGSGNNGIYQIDSATTMHKVVSVSSASTSILIKKGSNHNTIVLGDGSSATSLHWWEDVSGNAINLQVAQSYKWIIELYQGDGVVQSDIIGGNTVQYVDYSSISYDWYDNILSSGTILGSTDKRIQISNDLETELPQSSTNNTLVLQGKYVQLLQYNNSSYNQVGVRAYVQTYDSSYGHVYPKTGIFSQSDIESATHVVFYDRSNNPEDVLAGDKVACATTSGTEIELYINGEPNPDCGIGFTIDDVVITAGMKVLIKDQPDPKENGIYLTSEEGPWKRLASADTWGEYIGKIIFVEGGTQNGGSNFESLASAGGTLYYNENNSTYNTGSPLFFTREQPKILFPEQIDYTVNYVYKNNSNIPDDGCERKVGDIFLGITNDASHYISAVYKVTGINPATTDLITTLSNGQHIKVLNGQEYGGKIAKIASQPGTLPIITPYYGTSAVILKNKVNKTYISPFTGLQNKMALKLTNSQKVIFEDDSTSEFIGITNPNSVVYSIEHKTLKNPLTSYEVVSDNTPYKYEIRSYFRESDENPFKTYESPYLKIIVESDAQCSTFNTTTNKRYIQVLGEYIQYQQTSWESYRWILLDHNDTVIQDTGKKYDKTIETTFYGLSNDDEFNNYTAVLYLEDNMGNVITKTFNFKVSFAIDTTFNNYFKAEYDCNTNSMMLQFELPDEEENLDNYSFYRREREYFTHSSNQLNNNNYEEFMGEWEPVLLPQIMNYDSLEEIITRVDINDDIYMFRDYNIQSDHSYQYLCCNDDNILKQNFAMETPVAGTDQIIDGDIFRPKWANWSLTELIPINKNANTPSVNKIYKADNNNSWLFKFNLETGAQTQNLTKNEINTLGQYSKVGFGIKNYISGDITCLLGSEIVPYSAVGYVERLLNGITKPLSTNEKIRMLEQWRKIAYSKNPKLLKDIKGQSWIVQIFTNSNTPHNFYKDQPDSISFSWKQVESSDNCIILGNGDLYPERGCIAPWNKIKANHVDYSSITFNLKEGIDSIDVTYSDITGQVRTTGLNTSKTLQVLKGSDCTWTINYNEWYTGTEPEGGSVNNINGHIFENFDNVNIFRKTASLTMTRGIGVQQISLVYYNQQGEKQTATISGSSATYNNVGQGYAYSWQSAPSIGYNVMTGGGLVDRNSITFTVNATPLPYSINFEVAGTRNGHWDYAEKEVVYGGLIGRNGDQVSYSADGQTTTWDNWFRVESGTGYTVNTDYSSITSPISGPQTITVTTSRTWTQSSVSISRGTGVSQVYLSTDPNATSGSAPGSSFNIGETVYGFAKFNAEYIPSTLNYQKISGTIGRSGVIYRVGSLTVNSVENDFGTIEGTTCIIPSIDSAEISLTQVGSKIFTNYGIYLPYNANLTGKSTTIKCSVSRINQYFSGTTYTYPSTSGQIADAVEQGVPPLNTGTVTISVLQSGYYVPSEATEWTTVETPVPHGGETPLSQ